MTTTPEESLTVTEEPPTVTEEVVPQFTDEENASYYRHCLLTIAQSYAYGWGTTGTEITIGELERVRFICESVSDSLLCRVMASPYASEVSRSRTIIGSLFYILKNTECNDVVTEVCTLIMSLLEEHDLYRYAIIDSDRNLYQQIRQFYNRAHFSNRSQHDLITMISSYYLTPTHINVILNSGRQQASYNEYASYSYLDVGDCYMDGVFGTIESFARALM